MAFDDDELDAFYRSIEARTAQRAPRRRPARPPLSTPKVRCPHPEKTGYPDRAGVTAAILARRHAQPSSARLWCYECVCGRWHLTSRPPRD